MSRLHVAVAALLLAPAAAEAAEARPATAPQARPAASLAPPASAPQARPAAPLARPASARRARRAARAPGRPAARARRAARASTTISPGGVLRATVRVEDRVPRLTVRRHGRVVLRADLGRVRARDVRVGAAASRFSGSYATAAGKRRARTVHATRTVLHFGRRARLELGVADDGVAFHMTGFASQQVRYRPDERARGWLQRLTRGYEGRYLPVNARRVNGAIGYPALFRARGTYTLLTETAVPAGQPGEHLVAARGAFTTAAAEGAKRTVAGWRVAVIGSLADVVASDLPDDFAPPSRIADPSWIRPGRAAWSWWADSGSPRELEAQRRYVDFAHEAGFEYVLVDAGWDGGWVPELVEYAARRDVRVLLWTDWHDLATPAQRATLLDRWADWGVAGVKVDFLWGDTAKRMAISEAIAQDAAARRLHVVLHGHAIPRGLQRTWPNVLTLEGVRGAEHLKSGRADEPAHNVTLAFTRNVVGSMDYTPVTFSAPGRVSTAAAQLAQAIVYESGLQHYADHPEAYRKRPQALALLRQVPAAWDDVRLLSGAPGRSVTLARRAGGRWFVGALSATPARREIVDLSFLPKGRTFRARIYADKRGDEIAVTQRTVTSATRLKVHVARNGGFSIAIS